MGLDVLIRRIMCRGRNEVKEVATANRNHRRFGEMVLAYEPLLSAQPYKWWSDVKTRTQHACLHNVQCTSTPNGSMAQVAKKKLVVCGGNGFLGISSPLSTLVQGLIARREPHMQSRSAPRMGCNLDIVPSLTHSFSNGS